MPEVKGMGAPGQSLVSEESMEKAKAGQGSMLSDELKVALSNPDFHFIGELSNLSRLLIPPKVKDGGTTGQRMVERKQVSGVLLENILNQGDPHELHGSEDFAANRSLLGTRFGSPDDLPFLDKPREQTQGFDPRPEIKEVVDFLESTPFKDVPAAAVKALKEGRFTHKQALAGAMIMINRGSEIVSDHHGGPMHPTAGGFAVGWHAEQILKAGGDRNGPSKPWADLAIAQGMSLAARHVDINKKLAGPAVLAEIEIPAEMMAMTDPALVCDELRKAIVAGQPNRGERLLLRAHQLGATPDMVLGAFMEEAVPRGVVDDHYLLYPNYAVKTCEAIGWEHAPWVLRTVVRYLSTVPPPAKDLVGRNNYKLSEGTPAARRELGRVREAAEKFGILAEGALKLRPEDPATEVEASNALAWKIAEEIPATEDAEIMTDDEITNRVAPAMAEAMANGLSLEGALNGLSQAAARMMLRTTISNPMDVHFITGVGARRMMLESSTSTANKVLSLMLWGSGFEVTQRYMHYKKSGRGNYTYNKLYGAKKVPANVEKLLAKETLPTNPEALLDWISAAITKREGPIQAAPLAKKYTGEDITTHMQQVADMYSGKISVGAVDCGDEVATRVFPAVWLYANKYGGDMEAFFSRIAEHTALDDFTEMHAWKHAGIAHQEALRAPAEHRWIYMCAAAKVCCNHSGCGHRIYDRIAEGYGPELQKTRFDWHGVPDESLDASRKWRAESGR